MAEKKFKIFYQQNKNFRKEILFKKKKKFTILFDNSYYLEIELLNTDLALSLNNFLMFFSVVLMSYYFPLLYFMQKLWGPKITATA